MAPDFSFWNIQRCTAMNDRFSYALISITREKLIYISFLSITRRVQSKPRVNPKFYRRRKKKKKLKKTDARITLENLWKTRRYGVQKRKCINEIRIIVTVSKTFAVSSSISQDCYTGTLSRDCRKQRDFFKLSIS